MADAHKLKIKISKILEFLKIEEIKPNNDNVKFAFKLTPFESKNFLVIVEYLHKIDMIRVGASIGIGKNLKDNYKLKKENEKNEIILLFSKPIRARNFNAIIDKDFASLAGYKLLFQQNMSAQVLLDTVTEGIFLLQDLGELLFQADQSLKIPNVSETSKHMFQ